MATIKTKRVYEPVDKQDGFRLLVDRIWPRGIKKEEAHVDLWSKEIAPSTELRKWFGHDPQKWAAFAKSYVKELKHNPAVNELQDLLKEHKTVTLIYSARDEQHNQAAVLKDFLEKEQGA